MREKSVSLLLIALGTALLAWSATRVEWTPQALAFAAVFVAATIPLFHARVGLSWQMKAYAMDDITVYALAFITASQAPPGTPGWEIGIWIHFLAALIYETFFLAKAVIERGWAPINKVQIFYHFTNPFARSVYYFSAAAVYAAASGGDVFLGSWHNVGAIALSVLVYMATTITFDLADTWVRTRTVQSMVDFYSTIYVHVAMMVPFALILTLFWQQQRPAVLLLVLPIIILHASMKAVRSVLEEAQRTMEAMAAALEERDQYTAGHSERVARYAGAIATFIGLTPEDVQRIEQAGRIHDLGKIDIPDAILRKPCGLDDDEYQVMKTHTERNIQYNQKYTRLGKQIPFGIAALHHERWDGKGYYFGLSGEDIPIGARILSVSDTWDAMTSDRPYRKGLGDAEGLRRLEAAAGTQFDPYVVEAFLAAYAAGIIPSVLKQWQDEEHQRQEARRTKREASRDKVRHLRPE